MKKIGFVDYYISEWHANNYPKWIEKVCEESGYDYKVAYCWAELDASPINGETTDAWCEKFDVKKCATLEELCEKSDVIVILSPRNPETHLGYAETVLKYGKRTYIDKTFAPNLETAEKIFELGKKYNAPFFSTSALRYAEELDCVGELCNIIVTGGGSNLPEYFIHLGEMVVKKLGVGIKTVTAEKNGTQCIIKADYGDGKCGTMIYGANMPYNAYLTTAKGELWKSINSPFFEGLIADMLRFFESGETSFDSAETLEVMRLRDMALSAAEKLG